MTLMTGLLLTELELELELELLLLLLEGEPDPPEGAPVDEVVCAVEVGWVWPAADEVEEVLPGAVEEALEVVLGALEDAEEVACPPGDEGWVVEKEADGEAGGVVGEVEAQVDDVAGAVVVGDGEVVAGAGAVVVGGCEVGVCSAAVVVPESEAVVVMRTQSSEEFAPVGDVLSAGHASQSPYPDAFLYVPGSQSWQSLGPPE